MTARQVLRTTVRDTQEVAHQVVGCGLGGTRPLLPESFFSTSRMISDLVFPLRAARSFNKASDSLSMATLVGMALPPGLAG